MNKYIKYCPNVYLAQCSGPHQKGDIIEVENKHGNTKEHIVHNLIGMGKSGSYYYSITRADGTNAQTIAQAKADKRTAWAESAQKKSAQKIEDAREGHEFLVLGEPIKVGHHSEKRHRALIERNHNRMRAAISLDEKAEANKDKAAYWASRANDINLSMPESLEFYEHELAAAKERHAKIKSGEIPREHAFTLTYANKAVKDLEKKLETAKKLWG